MLGENVKLRRCFTLSTSSYGVVSSYLHTSPQPAREREREREGTERMGRSGVVLFLLFLGCFTASASFISVDDLNSDGNAGRRLLQQKTNCPKNFESANYTIVTSKCKGPQYPAELCCPAFKELVCPYRDYINDLESDCSTVMFSYLNNKGNYPPALFSNMCRDDKRVYDCTGIPDTGDQTSGSDAMRLSSVVFCLVGFVLALKFF